MKKKEERKEWADKRAKSKKKMKKRIETHIEEEKKKILKLIYYDWISLPRNKLDSHTHTTHNASDYSSINQSLEQ